MRPSEYDAEKTAKATRVGRPVARLERPGAISGPPVPLYVVTSAPGKRFMVTSFNPGGRRQGQALLTRGMQRTLEQAVFASRVTQGRLLFPDEATLRAVVTAVRNETPRLAQALQASLMLPVNYHVNVVTTALDRKYYPQRGTDTTSLNGWAAAFGVAAGDVPAATVHLFEQAMRIREPADVFADWDATGFDYEYAALDFLTGGRSLVGDIYGERAATNLATWWGVATRLDYLGRNRAAIEGTVTRVWSVGRGRFEALGPVTTRAGKRLIPLPPMQPDGAMMSNLGRGYRLAVMSVRAWAGDATTIVGRVEGRADLADDAEHMLTEEPYFGPPDSGSTLQCDADRCKCCPLRRTARSVHTATTITTAQWWS
ncbi:hypothetical protein [Isoptericola sp. NPDC055881]